jgi:hypothetical protein
MTRSFFAHVSHAPRGILALVALTLVSGLLFHAQFPSRVWAQQFETAAAKGPSALTETPSVMTSNDIFLQLAASVGQTPSEKKLID